MRSWARLVTVVIAAAILGLGVGAVFSDRSDPPPLPGPAVIDPVGSTIGPTRTPPPAEEPADELVPPRVIDDDDDDDGGGDGYGDGD
jgi:hypothetical protein